MSREQRAPGIVGRLALALGIAFVGYLLVYRPRQLRWGATDEEIARAMPGDEIRPHPIFDATRAVTIDAPPEKVWPWIVQIGYQRAGWYGYDLLDNAGVESARQIVPELQDLKVGDVLPIFTIAEHRVIAIEPNRYLLTKGDDGTTWIFALYPEGKGQTRFVWRMRDAPYLRTSWRVGPQLLSDAVDLIAVRDNMLGIKERVEGTTPRPLPLIYGELGLWLLSFLGYVVASVGTVVWRDWRKSSLVSAASSLVTIGLVLGRPPVSIDALSVVAVCAGVWWAKGVPRSARQALAPAP